MNFEEVRVSIVVPFFNNEKYLSRCIESIKKQTHRNLQIILVDDGSTDKSRLIAEEYAKNDDRIEVIHKKNTGVSDSRNIGISVANGEYICFSDGDDYLLNDYVSYLLNKAKLNNADISLSTEMFGNYNLKQIRKDSTELYSAKEAVLRILSYRIPIGVYNKMFNSDFLRKNKIEFNKSLYMGEGFNFNVDAFQRAKRIAVGHRRIYYYRRDNIDSVTTKFSAEKWENALIAIKNINSKLVLKKDKDIKNAIDFAWWRTNSDVYDAIILANAKENYYKLYEDSLKNIKKYALVSWRVPASFEDKIRAMVMYFFPSIVPTMLLIRDKKYHVNVH